MTEAHRPVAPPAKPVTPGRLGAASFAAKATAHRLARALRDRLAPVAVAAPGSALREAPVLAEVRTRLRTATDPAERPLEDGKVHNLRVAARALDGLEFPAGGTFSFWAQVGRPTRARGFVRGRELREGCVVPAVAGGVCQLSNALYEAALRADLAIVERHPHSRTVPGSQAALGRDATVFWNYLDLRFASPRPFRLEARLGADELVVVVRGERAGPRRVHLAQAAVGAERLGGCDTCARSECFRHAPARPFAGERAAIVVDERWPEFDAWLRASRGPRDVLLLPIDGRRFGRPRYAWDAEGYAEVRQHPWPALRRALEGRRAATRGAAIQRAALDSCDRLAAAMAERLPLDARRVVVAQPLLPWLWRAGALGGRRFTVLMTRLPLAALQARLDAAAALHPESPTLADFRAEPWRLEAEAEALAVAEAVVTPHAEVAALFAGRCERLPWALPRARPRPGPRRPGPGRVQLPASPLGRKGAYELRAALRGLAAELWVGSGAIEAPGFWHGSGVTVRTGPLADPDVVALPAFVEHQPRALLAALAREAPVIATAACGLGDLPGVHTVPAGDAAALRAALVAVLGREAARAG
jgi:hypothetical protein